jgi:hypothetical protein
MSLTFREVKSQLGAGSVAELKSILEQAQRPITEPISLEDVELLNVVYPLVKEGLTVENALSIYNEQLSESSPENLFHALRYQFVANGVEDALRNDVKLFYLLYFQSWKDALKSPEIINDPEVNAARQDAFNACLKVETESAVSLNQSFFLAFNQKLRQKGFLPAKKTPVLLEAATEINTNMQAV